MDKKIEELLARGVENIYPTREFLEKLLKSGKKLTIYTGYDPTAPTLHIGHGITMLKLRQFQDLGHKIIFLIGDFTGMIGDPTDKGSARQQLTREQVLENCKAYKKQASAILDFGGKNPVEIKYNSKWFSKMNFGDVLELSSKFTVQRMLERDMFQARMKDGKPIYVHEFMYPVMQAYDSVVMDVDGEVGGNDQTFNMLAGRDLMKIMKNKEKFVLTMKLLTDASGKKMGKTEGNMVALSDSAEDMFGKVMSWSDDMIMRGFELCTKIPAEDMGKIEKDLKSGGNPRDMKLRLAHGVVATFLGVKDAKKAEENFISQFSKKEMPKDIKEWMPELKKMRPIDILVQSGLCKSRGEARAVVRGRGMSINGVDIVNEVDAVELKNNDIIKKGSRGLKKVKF